MSRGVAANGKNNKKAINTRIIKEKGIHQWQLKMNMKILIFRQIQVRRKPKRIIIQATN